MRRLSAIFDFTVILGLTVSGLYRLPMALIALGAGLLAVLPILKYRAMVRARPQVDARQILRSTSIDATLHALAVSIAAYLVGRLSALLWGW